MRDDRQKGGRNGGRDRGRKGLTVFVPEGIFGSEEGLVHEVHNRHLPLERGEANPSLGQEEAGKETGKENGEIVKRW